MKELDKLYELVKYLRVECPWDAKQTFESSKSHLVEEAEEAREAITNKDFDNLKEELGDTLFNLLFIVNLAEEQGLFTLEEVMEFNHQKMVGRHPHVFGDVKASTPEEAIQAFLDAKSKEKKDS